MNNKIKYIGLNQRIPFEVMDAAIYHYLQFGCVDRSKILDHMHEFTSGLNRSKKAASYILKILSEQHHLLDKLKQHINIDDYNVLRLDERKALSLCLTSLNYPIIYNLLIALSQGFKVQEQLNKKFIVEKVMSIYGSNRTVEIAIDALMPMIIESNTIKRDKIGIYSIGPRLAVSNPFISELIIYTDIYLSGSKSILFDDINHRPWFSYFDLLNQYQYNELIQLKDSVIGRGYFTIKSLKR